MTLSTGIDTLDRKLDGGVEPGSIVAVLAPPEAQVAPLLCASIDRRPTRYYATVRTEDSVRSRLGQCAADPQIAAIEQVGVEGAIEAIRKGVGALGEGEDVVVDVLDPLEAAASTAEYVSFLNDLAEATASAGGATFLSCLDSGDEPANREFTLSTADYVLRLEPERTGNEITYYLEIPKAMGVGLSGDERVFQLDVGSHVSIDRSRNI